jgi:hypothetical protein
MAAARLFDATTNRTIVSVGGGGIGEAMRTGGTRGGGRLPIVSGGEWSDEKKKIERSMGPRIAMTPAAWRDATTNQMSAVLLEYIWARRRAGQRRLGRTPSHLFGNPILGQKMNTSKLFVA